METATTSIGKEICNTVISQLGGNRFIVMTGSKNFVYSYKEEEFWVRMDLTRNKAGVNRLKITLNWDDTYTMYFYKGTNCNKTYEYKITKEQTFTGIYCDQLQEIFTQVTGLYTSL